uniref:Uncharacterized protein n=1 Tax=Trichuris muris TaxID=70415 RepID=A0A5S6QNQ9_TRIMR
MEVGPTNTSYRGQLLSLIHYNGSVRTTYSATLTVVASTDPSDALQPLSEDRRAKDKSAEVVQDRITTFAQNSDRILRCAASAKLLVRSLSTTGPS